MTNGPMTQHPPRRERVRLSVVAALVSSSVPTDPATVDESRLADALRGVPAEPGGAAVPDAAALADLLALAEGTPSSGGFVTGLQQAFLIPDDSRHALAREETTAAFADVYRRLALPGLSGEAGSRALAILRRLART
jgi:hypothetical protein